MSDLDAMIRAIVAEELARYKQAANDPDMLTVAKYAQRWSLSESTVRGAIREKRLEHVRIGRAVRIPATARIAPPQTDTTRRALEVLGGGKR